MARGDWAELSGGLVAPEVMHEVTSGIARPNGGGNFCYGFNSTEIVTGVVALTPALIDFAPMEKGGSISAALKRGVDSVKRGNPYLIDVVTQPR